MDQFSWVSLLNPTYVLERSLKRKELLAFLSKIKPCIITMESGSGAHRWCRKLARQGHTPRIIDAKFVAPYRLGGSSRKNDRNDARAICEADGRPHMCFVAVKSEQQQAILIIHCRRSRVGAEHTRTANQIRGFLAEFFVVVPKGVATLIRR